MWTKKENIPAHNHGQETKHHLKISLFCLRCSFFFLIKIFYSTFNLEGISIWIEWWKLDKFLAAKMLSKTNFDIWIRGKNAKTFQRPINLFVWPRHTQTWPSEHFTLLEHFPSGFVGWIRLVCKWCGPFFSKWFNCRQLLSSYVANRL